MPVISVNGKPKIVKPGFNEIALKEMAGFTFERNESKAMGHDFWSGFGKGWKPSPSGHQAANTIEYITGMHGVADMGIGNFAVSGLRLGSTATNILGGFATGGILSGAQWAASQYITSGIIGGMAAGGSGLLAQTGAGLGGGIGMALTGGSPLGDIAGTWLAASIIEGGAAATAIGAGMPVMMAGMLAAGSAYYAGKGSYALMKAGYNRRQQLLRKIDTAGSTAAFMNKNAFTMRAKAIDVIRNNHLNARSAFGQEPTRTQYNSYRKFISNGMY